MAIIFSECHLDLAQTAFKLIFVNNIQHSLTKGGIVKQRVKRIHLSLREGWLIIFLIVEDGVDNAILFNRERHGFLAKITSNIMEPT